MKKNTRWRVLLSVAVSVCTLSPAAAPGQAVERAAVINLTEGVTVDGDGNVYFTDLASARILKLSPDGRVSTFRENSNVANGLLIDLEGRLVAAESGRFARLGIVQIQGTPRVTRTDLRTGDIELLADKYQGEPLAGPNDLTIDDQGRVYFTAIGGNAVYRIDGPGEIERILGPDEVRRPNGIQISPDGTRLYLVSSNEGESGVIRVYDLHSDGTVSNARVHYDFNPGRGADGMSIDIEGNLYAAAGINQLPLGSSLTLETKSGVYVISPNGELLRTILIPSDLITNTGFGGPDMRTLYVTAGPTVYKVRTEITGLPR